MGLPALESMAEQIKAAREAKGLSQRSLSERTGIPQSHISKIENAGSDIRISSMLTIAHALDLELTLVSRRLVTALKELQRQASQTSAQHTGVTLKVRNDLNALEKETGQIIAEFQRQGIPEMQELVELQLTIKELMLVHFSAPQAKGIQDRIKHLKRPLGQLKDLSELKAAIVQAGNYRSSIRDALGTINPITHDLRDLRHRFIHDAGEGNTKQIPAYRLDNNEEEDDV